MFAIINHKLFKMKKILFIFLLTIPTLTFCQKSAGLLSQVDDFSVIAQELDADYASNEHTLWDKTLSDNAVVYGNNSKMDGKTVKEIFKSHHTMFNDIQILDGYAHTNYFKDGNVWTNKWFIWQGTGNKTGVRYSVRCHFDYRWENGKIVEMLCFSDNTAFNMELAAQ